MIITEIFQKREENNRKITCQNMELKICLEKKKRKRIPKNCFKVNKKSAAQTLAAESTLFFHLLELFCIV